MTLRTFKKRLYLILIVFSLVVYGAGFFYLGKFSNNISLVRIRRAAAKNNLVTPVKSPIPFADVQSGSVIYSFVKLCSNTVYSFEISYPKDWFTTYNSNSQKCLFFAPYSFVVPTESGNLTFVPIKLEPVSSENWKETVKFYQNPNDFRNILSSQNIEINGRSVQKIKSITTDRGTLPKGFESVVYLLFEVDSPLAISYQQLEENEDTTRYEDILSEMVSSVRFY